MPDKISRRRFIMMGAMGAAALLVPDLAACSPITPTEPVSASSTSTQPVPTTTPGCQLSRLVVPTRPPTEPGYTQLDEATGLHMTGHPVDIDINSYRLSITGKVNNPLELSYNDLRCMPKITTTSTSICTGYFEDQATWAGVPFSHVLGLAGVKPEATLLSLSGADGYHSGIQIEAALLPDCYLAYEWEGQPVPILHGFPVRAIFDSQTGGLRVKWLLGIEVS